MKSEIDPENKYYAEKVLAAWVEKGLIQGTSAWNEKPPVIQNLALTAVEAVLDNFTETNICEECGKFLVENEIFYKHSEDEIYPFCEECYTKEDEQTEED